MDVLAQCVIIVFLWNFIQVQAKNLKGRVVIGVAAGRFHTVLWTKEAVYTMGLNGGQLGESILNSWQIL